MGYRLLGCCLVFLIYFGQPTLGVAGAVTIAAEAKTIAAEAQAAAKQAAYEAAAAAELAAAESAAAKAEAETAAAVAAEAQAKADLSTAEAKVAEADAKVTEAEVAAKQAGEAAKRAEVAELVAKAAAHKAEAAAVSARRAAEWEARIVEEAAAEEAASLDKVPIAELAEKAEIVAMKIDAIMANAESNAAWADKSSDDADAKAEWADKLTAEREKAADANVAASDALADAKGALQDAIEGLADAKTSVTDAETMTNDVYLTEREAKEYLEALKKPEKVTNSMAFEWENNYYYWQDDRNNSGYQFIQPYTFYYGGKGMEYGLSTAYIISEKKTEDSSRRVATWSDTLLTLVKAINHDQYSVRYSLDVNIPTGKANRSNQINSRMDDEDLVQKSLFGEGWNYTPGLSISHKISREDTWTAGMSYAFRGNYDSETPGNQWIKSLKWQHIQQKWQLIGELRHGNTFLNSEQGSELDANLTYRKELAKDQNLMLYYRNIDDDSLDSQYYGFLWRKTSGEKNNFRITGDFMNKSENEFIDKWRKYTGGLGYDIEFNSKSRLSIDVQQFYMKNGAATDKTNYKGYNLYVRYFYNY